MTMMDDIQKEAYEAVVIINDEDLYNGLYEHGDNDFTDRSQEYMLEFSSMGDCCCIEFCNVQIWNSEDDEREYNDEKDDYKLSIKQWLYHQMKIVIEDLVIIKTFLK